MAASAATAADIPVLGGGTRPAPGVAAKDTTPAPPTPRSTRVSPHAKRPDPLAQADAAVAAGTIDQPTSAAFRDAYSKVRSLARRASGRRGVELRGVKATVDGIAARRQLSGSRFPALTLTLERNAQWWGGDGALLASGARVSFPGSELIWQSVPGQGLQIHPLANFGLLNALFKSKSSGLRMTRLLDELLPLRAQRAGGTAWEYYYRFGGGNPPWVSGLAQGAGVQATARAASRAGRVDIVPALETGLAIFQTDAPEGVRVPFAGGGVHYAQYSYAPTVRIANGFAQSLVGLFDYAKITGSATAQQLFEDGMTSARKDLPTFDTGAWSLYSRGSVANESDLHYHDVLIEFLANLCDRTEDPAICDMPPALESEKTTPPTIKLVTRRLRAGRPGQVVVALSKRSTVRLQLRRGGKVVYTSTSQRGYGRPAWRVAPPRTARADYTVSVTATDLAGNQAEPVTGTIELAPPRARK